MKHLFLLLSVLIFILGCGVMSNPKEKEVDRTFSEPTANDEGSMDKIHVPQKFFLKFPKALHNEDNKTTRVQKPKREGIEKSRHPRWYN